MKRKLSSVFGAQDQKSKFNSAQKPAEAREASIPAASHRRIAELIEEEIVIEQKIKEAGSLNEKPSLIREKENIRWELETYIIQKSTKTTFPQFLRLHDKLRMKYRWYYNWHLLPYAGKVHWATLFTCTGLLIGFLAIMGYIALHIHITWASPHQPTLAVKEINPLKRPDLFFLKNAQSGKFEDAAQVVSDDASGTRIRTKSGTTAGYQDFIINANQTKLFDGEKLVAQGNVIVQEKVNGQWQDVGEQPETTPTPSPSPTFTPSASSEPRASPTAEGPTPSPEATISPQAMINTVIQKAQAADLSPSPTIEPSSSPSTTLGTSPTFSSSPTPTPTTSPTTQRPQHHNALRHQANNHLQIGALSNLTSDQELDVNLNVQTEGEGANQKVKSKQSFNLPEIDHNQRIVWEIALKNFDITADNSDVKDENDKSIRYKEYGKTIIDVSDFKGKIRWEEIASSDTVRIYFDEQGTNKAIEIDPIFTVTTPANQIVVDDGTRKWVFDSTLSLQAPSLFYHTSTGSGVDNLASTDSYNKAIGPHFEVQGAISSVTHTLVENTPTRVKVRVQGSYATTPINVDNYYTIYPTGEAFLIYNATTVGSNTFIVSQHWLSAVPQVQNHDGTGHTFVQSDTTNNNYSGMSVVPFTNSEFGGVGTWATNNTTDHTDFLKWAGTTTYTGNMVIDFSNYRATTTTRDNLRTDYRTPATINCTKGTCIGYLQGEGAYSITADASGDSGFTFGWDSKTRYKPAFKITNALRTEDVYQVSWGGAVKTKGVDYNLSRIVATNTVFMQILSDIGADITITIDSGATGNDIWTDGSTDGVWETDGNWSLGHAPTSSEIAVFGSTSTDDCVIVNSATVAGFTIGTGYTGNIWLDGNLLTVTGDWSQESGTFDAWGDVINVGGSWSRVGGTFTHHNNTVTFTSTSIGKTITSGGQAFYNLTFNGSGGGWTLNDNTTVANDLAVSAGTLTGGSATITASGSVNLTGGAFTAGTSTLIMNGSGKTLTGASQTLKNLKISGNTTLQTSSLIITSGGTLTVDNGFTLTITTVTLTMYDSGTPTINGAVDGTGTLILFDSTCAALTGSGTTSSTVQFRANSTNVIIPARTYGGPVVFYNNNASPNNYYATLGTAGSQTLNFSSTFVVQTAGSATMTVKADTWNPIVNITGNVSFTNGGGTPSITQYTGAGPNPWTITGDFTLANGSINMGSTTTTVSGSVNFTTGTVTAGTSTLKMDGLTKTLTGNSKWLNNLQISNNITRVGDWGGVTGTLTIDNGKTLTTGNLTMAKGSTTTINGILTTSGGTLFLKDTAGGNLSTSGTINGTVEFNTDTTDVVVPARTYPAFYVRNTTGSNRTVTLGTAGSQTITAKYTSFGTSGAGNLLVDATVHDPNPTMIFNDAFRASISSTGVPTIKMGSGTWSIGHWGIDVRGATIDAGNSTLIATTPSCGEFPFYSGGQTWNNVDFSGAGCIFTINDDLSTNGYFKITNGTVNATGRTLNIKGDFNRAGGTFTTTGSTVNLNGTSASLVHGSTSFNNLTINSTNSVGGRAVTLDGLSTQTAASLALTGAAGKILTLASSNGNNFTLNPTAVTSSTYLNVSHSTNTGVAFCADHSTRDTPNTNINWQISGGATCTAPAAPTGFSGTADSTTQITWNWTNNADNADNVRVENAAHANLSGNLASTTVTWPEPGLSVNTQYTRHSNATNDFGNTDSNADSKYTLANKPDAPTVNATSSTSLTIIINANSNPASTEFAIRNDTAGKYLKADGTLQDAEVWQNRVAWGGDGGKENTELNINSSYSYKVKARNGDNTETSLSDEASKYTLAAVPGDPTITAQSWDVASGNPIQITIAANGNPNNTLYEIYYDTDPGGTFVTTAQTWTAHNDGDNVAHNNRLSDITYYYKVKAKNGNGTVTGYNPANPAVSAQAAPAPPSIVGVTHNGIAGHTANAANSITWGWNANGTAPDGYKVYDYTGGACTTDLKATAINPAITVTENAGLATNTSYARCDRAYRGAITGKPSINFSAYTLIEPVSGITWGALAADSIALTPQNTPTNLNLGQSGIQYQNTTKGTGSLWQHDTTVYISGGLTPDTQYAFTIQSRNGDADTTATANGNKYTLANDPGFMTALALSSTDIKLDWLSGGAQSKFNLYRDGVSGVGLQIHSANDLTFTDTGLAASSTHTYYIYAANGDNIETTNFSTATATTQAGTPPGGGGSHGTKKTPTPSPSVGVTPSPETTPETVETEPPHIPITVVVNEPAKFRWGGFHFDWSWLKLPTIKLPTIHISFNLPEIRFPKINLAFIHLLQWHLPQISFHFPDIRIHLPSIPRISIHFPKFQPPFSWDLGDGTTAVGNFFRHTYTQVGEYIVRLKVTADQNRQQEIVKKVTVVPPPPEITDIHAQGADIEIEGKAYPESNVYLTISSNPITVSTEADKLGIFKYLFKQPEQKLDIGGHEIAAYSSVKTADNKEIKGSTSQTYNFFVDYQGQMAIVKKQAETWKWVALNLGLILIIIVLYWLFWRRIFGLRHHSH